MPSRRSSANWNAIVFTVSRARVPCTCGIEAPLPRLASSRMPRQGPWTVEGPRRNSSTPISSNSPVFEVRERFPLDRSCVHEISLFLAVFISSARSRGQDAPAGVWKGRSQVHGGGLLHENRSRTVGFPRSTRFRDQKSNGMSRRMSSSEGLRVCIVQLPEERMHSVPGRTTTSQTHPRRELRLLRAPR